MNYLLKCGEMFNVFTLEVSLIVLFYHGILLIR